MKFKKISKMDLYLRVLVGICNRAGYPTSIHKCNFKNNKYVRKVFRSGEDLKKFLRYELKWILG